jgi:hypothetical protein
MDQEFLDSIDQGSCVVCVLKDQAGFRESPHGRMNFGRTHEQISGEFGKRRSGAAMRYESGEHDHVLRAKAGLGHSVFANRE